MFRKSVALSMGAFCTGSITGAVYLGGWILGDDISSNSTNFRNKKNRGCFRRLFGEFDIGVVKKLEAKEFELNAEDFYRDSFENSCISVSWSRKEHLGGLKLRFRGMWVFANENVGFIMFNTIENFRKPSKLSVLGDFYYFEKGENGKWKAKNRMSASSIISKEDFENTFPMVGKPLEKSFKKKSNGSYGGFMSGQEDMDRGVSFSDDKALSVEKQEEIFSGDGIGIAKSGLGEEITSWSSNSEKGIDRLYPGLGLYDVLSKLQGVWENRIFIFRNSAE